MTLLVALEFSPDALRAAEARASGALLVRASAEALPFREGVFDTVVSSLVFCSVPDPHKGLLEVKRVLAPGGTLPMLEHVRRTSRAGAWLQTLVTPLWRRLTGGCNLDRATEATVEAAGLTLSERRAKGTMRRFVATRNLGTPEGAQR